MNLKIGKHVGLCVKSEDGFILERNDISISTCGHFCELLCLRKLDEYRSEHPEHAKTGFHLFPRIETKEGHIADLVICRMGREVVSFVYPLDIEIELALKKYEGSDLTASELKTVSLLLRGLSNQQIADKLFISKSTLKKHIIS